MGLSCNLHQRYILKGFRRQVRMEVIAVFLEWYRDPSKNFFERIRKIIDTFLTKLLKNFHQQCTSISSVTYLRIETIQSVEEAWHSSKEQFLPKFLPLFKFNLHLENDVRKKQIFRPPKLSFHVLFKYVSIYFWCSILRNCETAMSKAF